MSINFGDSPRLQKARQLRPTIREAQRKQEIKLAQEQEYLRSIQEREAQTVQTQEQLDYDREQLKLERERIEVERTQKEVDKLDLLNALLDEVAKTNNRLVELEQDKIPLGKTFPLAFTVSDKLVRIDFVTGKDSYGVPASAYSILPFQKIRGLTVTNDGPGDVAFSTNDYPIDRYKGATVVAHTAAPVNFDQAVIYSLTVGLVSGSSAGIRVVGVY